MEEKISIRNILIAIFGSCIVNQIFLAVFAFALQFGYGINDNFYFGGRVNFNFYTISSIIVSALLTGIFVGVVVKKRGWLYGSIAVLVPYLLLWGFTLLWSSWRLTEHGKIWLKNTSIDNLIWTGIALVFCGIGGHIGEKIYKMEKVEEEQVVTYYFSPSWRLFFTIPFLSFMLFIFIFQIQKLWLLLKWCTIGLFYITLSPSLWLWGFIMSFFIVLLELAYISPIFALYWVYLVAHSLSRKTTKVISIIGIIIAVLIGSTLAGSFGYMPIVSIANSVTARGGQIWGILLDDFTYPIAHGNLYEYYKDKDSGRANLEKNKAEKGFIRLADRDCMSGFYERALNEYKASRHFAEDDVYISYKEGLCYYKSSEFEKALGKFQYVLQRYPNDVAAACNLALVYTETKNPNNLEYWERCRELVHNTAQDFKGKKDFIEWISNYIENPKQYYPSYEMRDYITKLPLSF